MKLQRSVLFATVFLALGSHNAFAQAAAMLKPDVMQFVTVDDAVVALTHARVIDGTGGPVGEDFTIVLRDGKIAAVGPSAHTPVPPGAKVIDVTGHTVIPGIVGMHDHMYFPAGGTEHNYLAFSAPRLYLGSGVTTVRTAGSIEPYRELNLKHDIDTGVAPGPKMYVSGPYLQGPGPGPKELHPLTGVEDARRTVAYWADEGVTWFKAYTQISRADLGAAIDEAHKRGVKVTAHLCSVTFREAAALGIDGLEHGLTVDTDFHPGKSPDVCPSTPRAEAYGALDMNGDAVKQTIQELISHKISLTSTLAVGEMGVPGHRPFDQRVVDAVVSDQRDAYLARRAQMESNANPANAAKMQDIFRKAMKFEFDFVKAGGLMGAGMDPSTGNLPGFGDQRNLALFVEAGFTPAQAIQIMTSNGAKILGATDRGVIAPGKVADLVVVKGDLTKNQDDMRNVVTVFKDGVGYDSWKLIDSVKGLVGLR